MVANLPADEPGLCVRSIPRPYGEELSIVASFGGARSPAHAWRRIAEILVERRATVVAQEIFGPPALLAELPGSALWPVTRVGDRAQPLALSGTTLWAVSGTPVSRLSHEGRPVGSVWSDGGVHFCRLGDMRPAKARGTPRDQARATLELMESTLVEAGFSFADVVRTWFYNHDILGWYRELNLVRDQFFRERGIFEGLVPASTGIGGANPHGTALSAELLAVRPKGNAGKAAALPSPLQCPAPEYGSAFSRAVELSLPGQRRILVSGTASIDPSGATAYPGNPDAQVDLTLRVVSAILRGRGAGFGDVVRGIAYLRREEDAAAWRRQRDLQGLADLPIVMTRNEVCREELLFELEVDAVLAV
jgi:enamine deaminase RidA (YjgF/YER057c/UK114 family)